MLKNGTFASPAMALASNVLPVPGAPSKSTPLGILAPTLVNLAGSLRNSTISSSSSFSSFSPATSFKVTLPSPTESLARLFPKFIILLLPPAFWLFIITKKNTITMIASSTGNTLVRNQLSSCTFLTSGSIPWEISSSSISLTSVAYKVRLCPFLRMMFTSPVGVCLLGAIPAKITLSSSRS